MKVEIFPILVVESSLCTFRTRGDFFQASETRKSQMKLSSAKLTAQNLTTEPFALPKLNPFFCAAVRDPFFTMLISSMYSDDDFSFSNFPNNKIFLLYAQYNFTRTSVVRRRAESKLELRFYYNTFIIKTEHRNVYKYEKKGKQTHKHRTTISF